MAALSIPARFAEQLARTPQATAVTDAATEATLSYQELDQRANQLAHHLIGLGVGREDRIAVLMQRSTSLVVAFLAILKAGAVYLPIHESYPADRRQWVIDQTRAAVLLTDTTTHTTQLPAGIPTITVNNPTLKREPTTDPAVPIHPSQLAYVIHTSGSTGQPKGVAVTQQDVVRLLTDPQWSPERYTRLLLLGPHAFDIFVLEVWLPLLHGGQIIIAPPGRLEPTTLRHLITKHHITGLHLTAGLFRVIAEEAPETLHGLHEVLTGGDIIAPTAVNRILHTCNNLTVRAAYGTTEATILSTHLPLTNTTPINTTIPLGNPLTGVTIRILDKNLTPVPANTPGEIYLADTGIARGYLHQPALTAHRFIADPHGTPGSRMYRTGDLARQTTNGELQYLGRTDNQLKIRGYLIEPAEIEATLTTYPGVAQAIVLPHQTENNEKQLIAYIVPENNTLDLTALHTHTKTQLPDYMIPTTLIQLNTLPLTPNGKLDRNALPKPHHNQNPTTRPPQTPLQHTLCQIFSTILNIPNIGIDDNFFDLGGQSLQAMRLLNQTKTKTGTHITINTLFDAPTVAQLATIINTKQTTTTT